MNGGHISNLLEVTSEGALRITYSGGETCGGGKRSTLIMLKCSSVRVSEAPWFCCVVVG